MLSSDHNNHRNTGIVPDPEYFPIVFSSSVIKCFFQRFIGQKRTLVHQESLNAEHEQLVGGIYDKTILTNIYFKRCALVPHSHAWLQITSLVGTQ